MILGEKNEGKRENQPHQPSSRHHLQPERKSSMHHHEQSKNVLRISRLPKFFSLQMLAGRGQFTLNSSLGGSPQVWPAGSSGCLQKMQLPGFCPGLTHKHVHGEALELTFNKTPGLSFQKMSLCFTELAGVQDTAFQCPQPVEYTLQAGPYPNATTPSPHWLFRQTKFLIVNPLMSTYYVPSSSPCPGNAAGDKSKTLLS